MSVRDNGILRSTYILRCYFSINVVAEPETVIDVGGGQSTARHGFYPHDMNPLQLTEVT